MVPVLYRVLVETRFSQRERDYALARQTWDAHHISHYWYLLDAHICGSTDYRIVRFEVKNGATISMSNPITHEEIHDRCPENFNSIEKLFTMIDSSIRFRADRLVVEYESHYGYPKTVDYDLRRQAEFDEGTFEITDFGVLN